MIDALLYAVRDGIRASGIGYDHATCEITDDGKPPPRAGNVFVAIHGGTSNSTMDNCLHEEFGFKVTLTMRLARVAIDRVGDQLIARNLVLNPEGQRQGFNHKIERIRAFLHMNWCLTVLEGQTPMSANDNIKTWAEGTVYGFCEPMRYRGAEMPTLVGAEWFSAEPGEDMIGVKAEMRFDGARRFQPHFEPAGEFV